MLEENYSDLIPISQFPYEIQTSYFSFWFFHFIDQILSLSGQIPISQVKNGRDRFLTSILEIYRCHTLKDVSNTFFLSSINHPIFKSNPLTSKFFMTFAFQ
jgi:hypothetical protein